MNIKVGAFTVSEKSINMCLLFSDMEAIVRMIVHVVLVVTKKLEYAQRPVVSLAVAPVKVVPVVNVQQRMSKLF